MCASTNFGTNWDRSLQDIGKFDCQRRVPEPIMTTPSARLIAAVNNGRLLSEQANGQAPVRCFHNGDTASCLARIIHCGRHMPLFSWESVLFYQGLQVKWSTTGVLKILAAQQPSRGSFHKESHNCDQ
jgi:hypothetical protein